MFPLKDKTIHTHTHTHRGIYMIYAYETRNTDSGFYLSLPVNSCMCFSS